MLLKKTGTAIILLFSFLVSQTQENLGRYYEQALSENDTLKMIAFSFLAESHAETDPDSTVFYAEKSLQISQKLGLKLEQSYSLGQIGYALTNLGNYPRSLQTLLNGIELAKDPGSEKKILSKKYINPDELNNRATSPANQRLDRLAWLYQYVGILYGNANNYQKEKLYNLEARRLASQTGNLPLQSITNGTLGRVYLALKMTDSALVTEQEAYDQVLKSGYLKYRGSILLNLARVHSAIGNRQAAIEYFKKALDASAETNYLRGVVATNLALGEIYEQSGKHDSALYFILTAETLAHQLNSPSLLLRSYRAKASHYKTTRNNDSVVKYQGLVITINDSLFNTKQAQQFQNIDFDAQQRQLEKQAAEESYRYRLRLYGLLTGLGIVVLVLGILWRNNRQRQRAYSLLIKQKRETDLQKSRVEQTLNELQTAQKQLIQSEKMASLGELTAGIAHEIQNPLNFVNNFSEVNKELIAEMRESLDNGNLDEAKNISRGIEENEEKIIFHGKRADSIVKSMLQHSRSSSGQKESTDINALCDEYLRLAYHGLRAKDKSFNAKFETDLDPSIPRIEIIPQDFGRVLLNLINNAFYAVSARASTKSESDYVPTVTVRTRYIPSHTEKPGNLVEIRVQDNGTGIPENIKEKIFQPFFSTKPTGQGTGLGLSLSYDIIKAQGGTFQVVSAENKGSEFIVSIPVNP